MGQYKVPQDVEAEDKLIGFLTLKQFIYVVIGLGWLFVSFQFLKALPFIFILVGVPPAGALLMLGLVQRQGQPFETYFVAMISFYFKPRKRLWHKDPIVEVFKLEAPKIVTHENQRNPAEVRSQLEQIASIVDTRGWSTEKAAEGQASDLANTLNLESRIVAPDATPSAVNVSPDDLADDILDFKHNPNADNLNALIDDAVKTVHDEAVEKMKEAAAHPAPQPAPAAVPKPAAASAPIPPAAPAVAPVATTPAPATVAASQAAPAAPSVSEMTPNPLAGILKLAMDNDALKISQIAAQAQKQVVVPEGQSVSLRPQPKVAPAVAVAPVAQVAAPQPAATPAPQPVQPSPVISTVPPQNVPPASPQGGNPNAS